MCDATAKKVPIAGVDSWRCASFTSAESAKEPFAERRLLPHYSFDVGRYGRSPLISKMIRLLTRMPFVPS